MADTPTAPAAPATPRKKTWFYDRTTLSDGTSPTTPTKRPRVGNGSVITPDVVEDLIEESLAVLDGGNF